jgi:hypothetical protein
MGRMVNDRLIFILEKENLLAPAQCGFRRHRSAVDHLISLKRQIQICFVLRQQLVTVFFDLEKAYDTTWRFGILRARHGWKFRGQSLYRPTFICYPTLRDFYFLLLILSHFHGVLILTIYATTFLRRK